MVMLRRDEMASHALFRDIGIEPLSEAFDGASLARLLAGKATPLKAALLDQRLIAGLGNIYVCEALHRAGLSPRRALPARWFDATGRRRLGRSGSPASSRRC